MPNITDAANAWLSDYVVPGVPSSGEKDPPKAEGRAVFSLVDSNLTAVVNGVTVGSAVVYATRAALFADLAQVAGKLGVVYADSTAAYNGVYVKVGASGSGSWTLTSLVLSSSFIAALNALTARVDAIEGVTKNLLTLSSPIIVDADPVSPLLVIVPKFTANFNGVVTTHTPSDSVLGAASYDFINVALTANTQYNYVIGASIVGTTNPFGVVNTGAPFDGTGIIPIGQAINNFFSSPYRLAKAAPNQFTESLSPSNPLAAPVYFGTTVAVPVTDSGLTARGFTLGAKAPDGNSFYGANAPADLAPNPWFMLRVYVQTSADNAYPAQILANVVDTVGGVGVPSQYQLTLERRLSTRSAVFSVRGKMATGGAPVFYTVGSFSGASTWIFAGLQASFSNTGPVEHIALADYPMSSNLKAPDFVIPARLFLRESDTRAVRPLMASSDRRPGDYHFGFGSAPQTTNAGGNPSDGLATADGFGDLMVNSDDIGDGDGAGATAEILIHGPDPTRSYRGRMAVSVAPLALTGSPKILMIGDSLTQYMDVPNYLYADLVARGMTPTMVGTMAVGSGGHGTALAEGRGGRKFGDYTNQTTDMMAPVTVGGEAAYLALSTGAKQAYNPFLRVATGGDSASGPTQIAYNGYVFDLAFYLARWTPDLVTPTHIPIWLGTNDIDQTADDAVAASQINNGLRVMYAQCRAAAPTAKIGLVISATGPSTSGLRWKRHHKLLLSVTKAFVTAKADANLTMIPLYMHMALRGGWPYVEGEVNADGLISVTNADALHFGGPNRVLAAEVIADWVATA